MTQDPRRLRVAVFNPLVERVLAERCLEKRFVIAAERLGWDARTCRTCDDVDDFAPELVIALHQTAEKQTSHLWYGCMWHPPAFFDEYPSQITAVLSYDGYLVANAAIRAWLIDLIGVREEHRIVGTIQPSVNAALYRPARRASPRLVYAGAHWDGERHRALFERLDWYDWMDIYGPPGAWAFLTHAYRGVLPFDGVSVIDAIRDAGAGLCLHHEHHRASGTASLRIFEIAAAGAVAISERHEFVERYFGDSALFIDERRDPVEEIARHLGHISWYPGEAEERSRLAHRVLLERFTLEHMLSALPSAHFRLRQRLAQENATPTIEGRLPAGA